MVHQHLGRRRHGLLRLLLGRLPVVPGTGDCSDALLPGRGRLTVAGLTRADVALRERTTTAMPCNCGGGTPQTVIGYQLNLPDGTIRRYVTYQEAEAANQRAG